MLIYIVQCTCNYFKNTLCANISAVELFALMKTRNSQEFTQH